MKVCVDEDRCVGSGMCVVTAPDIFDQRESDGIVRLLQEEPQEARAADVIEAVERCPTQAISIVE